MKFRAKNYGEQKPNTTDKNEKKEMKTLREQVQKSRIAVEHITQFKNDQKEHLKCVDEIRHELKQCVIQINSQEKRNKVLQELIQILKGQMNKMKTKEKNVQEKEDAELEKTLKVLREDIDKIEQKRNQQVAKIGELKEKANESRSERVVFSSLFKKMEKELKQHEQIYKEQLLNNEKMKAELVVGQEARIKTPYLMKKDEKMEESYFEQVSERHYAKKKKREVKIDTLSSSLGMPSRRIKTECRESKINSDVHRDEQMIKKIQDFRERLKLVTGFEDHHEIMDQFQGIEGSNEDLWHSISCLEEELFTMEKQILKMKRKQFEDSLFQFDDTGTFDEFEEEFQKEDEGKEIKQFEELCGILGVEYEENNRIDDAAIQIEGILQKEEFQIPLKYMLSDRRHSTGNVNSILLKMEKFGQCDKIYDKEGFYGEYQKQLRKKNKTKIKK